MEIIEQISKELINGNDKKVSELTQTALNQGLDTSEILDKGLIAGMNVIGRKFKNHEIFLPDVLMAAKAMNYGMEILKPLLIKNDIPSLGKIVIGTIYGDLHDLGKNLVGIMLKGAGIEVIDLGKNVPPEMFVETAIKEDADIIGMSALLTTTMPNMKKVIDILDEKGLRGKIKTVIGGAPVNTEYAKEIGADAYAFDATNSVDCVREMLGVK